MQPQFLISVGIAAIVWWLSRDSFPEFSPQVQQRFLGVQYPIILYAQINNVPAYVMFRIAFIESAFDIYARGSSGELGLFQITPPLLHDFNRINYEGIAFENLTDPFVASRVAAWAVRWHLDYYNGDLEKAVRAYNTGRGNIDSGAGNRYWSHFQRAGQYFPERG